MNFRRTTLPRVTSLALAAVMAVGWGISGPAAVPAQAAQNESTVTITPNPSYRGREFQGWGTSLVWFANATGDYPEPLRSELYEKVFSAEGMNLNIARYNVGGGNASDVPDYLRYGAAVEGWWAPNDDPESGPLSTYDQRDLFLEQWDPTEDSSYNWNADQSQRWWVGELAEKRDDMVWEAFSNSPPYFMTNSGFVTGNFNSRHEQVATVHDAPTKFAEYLAAVVSHMEQTYGIEFTSVDPFNEPCAGYWGTTIVEGEQWPRKGGTVQEGAQICPGEGEGQQQSIIAKLSQALAGRGVDARVAANDETNPANFNRAWAQYSPDIRSLVGQINVHTYGTGGIQQARDIAKANDRPLWMSEVGGDFLQKRDENGAVIREFDPVHFSAAVGFAQKVISDLRQLEPDNYVFWQEIEDYYNMEKVERLNWGSVFVDFDCNDSVETRGYSTRRLEDAGWVSGEELPESAKCEIVTNSKYNAMRNFTHYITPGSHLIAVDEHNTTAAITPEGLRLVHVNPSSEPQAVTVDLSNFDTFATGATVTPVVTTQAPGPNNLEGNALVEGTPVAIADEEATITVPGMSVTTFVVDGVSGIADDAELIGDGKTYVVNGKKSGKPLTGTERGVTIENPAATPQDVKTQLWTFHRLSDSPYAGALRYTIENGDGRFLGATSAGTDLRDISGAEAAADSETVWILNTTDASSVSLLNASLEQVLDVNGESNQSGTPVGTWSSSGGAHQQWYVYQPVLQGILPSQSATPVGVPPELPATVVPLYAWGQGDPVPVSWDVDSAAWDRAGAVVLHGSGEDLFGNHFNNAELLVDVGPLDVADPSSVTVAAGNSRERVVERAPRTVTARMENSAATHKIPVAWDFSGIPDVLDEIGFYSVSGTVAPEDNHGRPLEARLTIIVTEPSNRNILTAEGVQTTASYSQTEYETYDPANTRNGDRSDKAWSTWGPGRQYSSDYLEYRLPSAVEISSAQVFFYRDGTNKSWADTVRAEYWDGEEWITADTTNVDSSRDPLTVDLDFGAVITDRVRIHMDAANYLTVSEVELYSLDAAPSSLADLGVVYINNVPVEGFTPDQTEYHVDILGSGTPTITALPVDREATVEYAWSGDVLLVRVVAADGVTHKEYHVTVQHQVNVLSVTIDGKPAVGADLRAVVASDPADATYTFQWLRDGEEIRGATADHYSVIPSDQGHSIAVRVIASSDGYLSSEPSASHPDGTGLEIGVLSSNNSLASIVVGSEEVAGFSPEITEYNVTVVGSLWPVVTGIPQDSQARVEHEFDDVSGTASITVTAENGQSRIYRVRIQRQVDVTSLAIVGNPIPGQTLVVETDTDPDAADMSFQWNVDGDPIAEGTTESLVVLPHYIGKSLSVQVTASHAGYLPGTRESHPVTIVAGADDGNVIEELGDNEASGESQEPNELSETGARVGILIGVVAVLLILGVCAAGASLRRREL